MKQVRSPKVIRDAAFLSSCATQEARAWLRERGTDFSSVLGTPRTRDEDHLNEYILLRRRHPAIDLALAEHGHSGTVLGLLYRRAPEGLRAVLCSNASLFVGDSVTTRRPLFEDPEGPLLWQIIQSGSLLELRAICENPNFSSYFYSGLMKAWPEEDGRHSVSEERFRQIIEFLSENPRISRSREESAERYYLDGSADWEYSKFYVEAWKLADKVPVTPQWAQVLARLYENLNNPYDALDDVEATLERWRPDDEGEFSPFKTLRQAISRAFLKPSLQQLRHEDQARRIAFIETFDPRAPEFRDLDWSEFREADRYWRFAASKNMKIWASPDGRQKFKSQLWADSKEDSDITPIGYFNEEADRLRETHPEWFEDEDSDEDEEGIFGVELDTDPVEKLRSDVSDLVAQIRASRERGLTMGILFAAGMLVGGVFF